MTPSNDMVDPALSTEAASKLAQFQWGLALILALLVRLPAVASAYPYLGYIDEGHVLHPVTQLLAGHPWDPRANGYPALPIVAIAATARLVALVVDPWRSSSLLEGVGAPSSSYDEVTPPELIVVAQGACLLMSLGIVVLVGLLGRRVAGAVGGSVAVWAAALLPALVARGAIITVDGFATFFVLAASLSVAAVRGPRDLARLALAGACSGLALVSKYPAGLVGLAVVATVVLAPWPWLDRLRAALVASAAGALAAIAVMPSLVLQPQAVWESMLVQQRFYESLELGSYWVQAFRFGEWDLPLPYPEIGVAFAVLTTVGVGLLLASRTWSRLTVGWLLFAATLTAVHTSYSFQPFRNLLPLAALSCVPVGFLAMTVAAHVRRPQLVLVGATALLSILFVAPVRHSVSERLALVDSRREAIDWLVANRPSGRVLIQREAAFVQTELARLGSRVRVVKVHTLGRVAAHRASIVVVAHVVGADARPLMDEPVAAWLRQHYAVSASFGETTANADTGAWKGNRMRIWILEPTPARSESGRP